MRRLYRLIVGSLAVIGLVFVGTIGLGIWAALRLQSNVAPALPDQMILSLDLEAEFTETAPHDPLAQLSGQPTYSLHRVVAALDAAALDQRVAGLFASGGDLHLGMGQVQELRDAIARFRASGKPTLVFAETIGEAGNGTGSYYLASAFEQIWMQPSGDVGLTGFAAESPFLRGTLDLLGIQARFAGRKEYKTAIETFTDQKYSAANAETVNGLLDAWTAQTIGGIAQGRKLPEDKVQALFGKGPFLSNEALSAGLVDHLGYRTDAWDAIDPNHTGDEVDVADYAAHLPKSKGPRVALIVGSGAIQRGEADGPFGPSDQIFASATIAQAIRDAIDDDDIRAILLRIDSPGGSYVASDTVWNEIRRARQAGKPVVASMGDVAASGGYFVAMGADRIIAQPGTITGSIGVFTGKMVMADFWKKLGVSWDELHRGNNAAMWSSNSDFSPAAWDRVNALLDHIYGDFTSKAAQGRNMPLAKLEALARGRVWSGSDAKRLGLVDDLGGYDVALAHLRQLLTLPADQPLTLVSLPEPQKPWDMIIHALSSGSQDIRVLARTAAALSPLVRLGQQMGSQTQTLSAPLPVIQK